MHSEKLTPKWIGTRRPNKFFAIVGAGRTGSTHLASLLDSHPDIACWHGELFDFDQEYDKSGLTNFNTFLNRDCFQINCNIVGFKFLINAMRRFPTMWEVFKQRNIRLIQTYRENKLDELMSSRLAEINKAFTHFQGSYIKNKISLSYHQCLSTFEFSKSVYNEIKQKSSELGITYTEIEYNDICKDISPIVAFLDQENYPLKSTVKKQREGKQCEIIENYEALKKMFADSEYNRFFVD